MIAGAMLFSPITLSGTGTRARVVSSAWTSCSSTVAPRPPYSCGQETAAQPASAIVAFQARSVSNAASSLPRRRPAATTSSVRFAASHPRSSLRTCSTSGGYEKSTVPVDFAAIDCGQCGTLRRNRYLVNQRGSALEDVWTGGETSTAGLQRLGLLVAAGSLMVANRLLSSKALHSILRPGALRSAPSTESDKHD